jgi:transcriptional regulator with XRE-family HTH domain
VITRSEQLREMKEKAYRHGLVNAQIEIDLPFQIRALRKQRGWTQPELALRAEMKQPRISAMEKPGRTNFSLETLKRLAEAFDVALIVRFASFGDLLSWSDTFLPDEFEVPSFDKELAQLEQEPERQQPSLPDALRAHSAGLPGKIAENPYTQAVIAMQDTVGRTALLSAPWINANDTLPQPGVLDKVKNLVSGDDFRRRQQAQRFPAGTAGNSRPGGAVQQIGA